MPIYLFSRPYILEGRTETHRDSQWERLNVRNEFPWVFTLICSLWQTYSRLHYVNDYLTEPLPFKAHFDCFIQSFPKQWRNQEKKSIQIFSSTKGQWCDRFFFLFTFSLELHHFDHLLIICSFSIHQNIYKELRHFFALLVIFYWSTMTCFALPTPHGSANHFDMLQNEKKIDWPSIDDKNRRFRLLNIRLQSVWTHLFSIRWPLFGRDPYNWPNTIIIVAVMDAAAVTVLL